MADRLPFTFNAQPYQLGAPQAGQFNLGTGFNYGPSGQLMSADPSTMSMNQAFGTYLQSSTNTMPPRYQPTGLEQAIGYQTNGGNYVPGYAGIAANLGLTAWQAKTAKDQTAAFQDSVDLEKKRFEANYTAQKKNYNSSIRDRQAARIASNPNAYQSVDAYMKENGI